jgi:hypothetical protein
MLKPRDTPMYEYLYDVLKEAVPECAAISYQTDGALPDAFAVFYLVAGNPQAFFSGRASRENERYSVAYYDRDKRNLIPKADLIHTAMKNGGFMYVGRSADLYHEDTEHWVRTLDFRYYEENKEG